MIALAPLVLGLGLGAGTLGAEARQLFERASQDYEAGRVELALREFTKARELDPVPAFLFNMGQCERALHHWERAAQYYGRYLAERPDAKNAAEVRALLADIEARPSRLGPARAGDDEARRPVPQAALESSPPAFLRDRKTPWFVIGGGALGVAGGIALLAAAISISSSDHQALDVSTGLTENSLTRGQAGNANALASAGTVLLVLGACAAGVGSLWLYLGSRAGPAPASP